MEKHRSKCFNKNHKEINANIYCQICKVFLCNKCENFHSELHQDHITTNIDKDINEIFTGYCKEKEHFNKLKYFCKNHNILCCASCITKIKGEGNGQHTDCNIYLIEDIKEEKKNKLKENIKYLEDLSLNFEESINKLKEIYEKINNNKEELKLNILKIFTNIRNEINKREDEIINEIDKLYNNIYFDDNLIKKSEKVTNQIKLNLEEGKMIEHDWEDNNKCISFINNCINIENNINYINEINKEVQNYNSLEINLKFNSDNEKILNEIKNFGEIKRINNLNKESLEYILSQSKIIENKEQIKLIKEWLPYNNKEEIKCKLIYDAKKDGDDIATFHTLCDNKGATLTIISTSDNKKIGGFLSKSFGGNKGFIEDNDAFLFSLNYNEKFPSLKQGCHYKDKNDKGLIFGNICIEIADKCLNNKNSYYHPYTCRYNFGKRNNNSNFNFSVVELEIYQIISEENLN